MCKWLIFSKQKHINDYVKEILHYKKRSCVYFILFLTLYNEVAYTVDL